MSQPAENPTAPAPVRITKYAYPFQDASIEIECRETLTPNALPGFPPAVAATVYVAILTHGVDMGPAGTMPIPVEVPIPGDTVFAVFENTIPTLNRDFPACVEKAVQVLVAKRRAAKSSAPRIVNPNTL